MLIDGENKCILAIIKILDPSAWINRYLTHASVSWKFEDANITGIKANKFNSSESHNISQLFLDIAIITLVVIIIIIDSVNGDLVVIKTWLELNHQIGVRSLYFTR